MKTSKENESIYFTQITRVVSSKVHVRILANYDYRLKTFTVNFNDIFPDLIFLVL